MTIWNMASFRARTYRGPLRTVHGPVGTPITEEMRAAAGACHEEACDVCGTHVCSCEQRAALKRAQEFMRSTPADEPLCAECKAGRFTRAHAKTCLAPTPGTFAWLKTLAPETEVQRKDFKVPYTAGAVLRSIHEGPPNDWLHVTDWQLFEEKPAGVCDSCKRLTDAAGVNLVSLRCATPSCPNFMGGTSVTVNVNVGAPTLEDGKRIREELYRYMPLGNSRMRPEHMACDTTQVTLNRSVEAGELVTTDMLVDACYCYWPSQLGHAPGCAKAAADKVPTFKPGDRVRMKGSSSYATVRAVNGDKIDLWQCDGSPVADLTVTSEARGWEHALKAATSKAEPLLDRATRLRPIARNKDLSFATALITDPNACVAGQVQLTVSRPGHAPAFGVVVPTSTDEDIIRLWAQLITWISRDEPAPQQPDPRAEYPGDTADKLITNLKVNAALAKHYAREAAQTASGPAPFDDEALVLLFLKYRHCEIGTTERTTAWGTFFLACPSTDLDRIMAVADRDDERLAEMWRGLVKSRGGSREWRAADAAYLAKIEAREAIGDKEIHHRIRMLANAK